MKHLGKMTVKILGDDWAMILVTKDEFKAAFGGGAKAITLLTEKEVYLKPNYLEITTVVHELTHCYLDYLLFPSVNMEPLQWEEFMCEVFGKYSREINTLAAKVLKTLKKGQNDNSPKRLRRQWKRRSSKLSN